MCIYMPSNAIRIASKNIICIKVLNERLCSPFYGKQYKLNKIYHQDITFKLIDTSIYTSFATKEGLYTYAKSHIKAVNTNSLMKGNLHAYIAVIPKGSHYVTDGDEYCSNTLVIIGKLRHPVLIKPTYYYYKLRNKISNLFK